ANIDFTKVNPVTGPIRIAGAEPGDALEVEILDFDESGWGWTALIPGFGLLADQFPDPYLHISRYADGVVEFTPEIRFPSRPFPGTIGGALAEPGLHSVVPPREVGGNLDIRDLTHGSRLLLPVQVPGALFSVGDTHAAQGDGEVCGTAIESPMNLRLRFGLRKASAIKRPQFEVQKPLRTTEALAGYEVTTGIGPDLIAAARDAVSGMIDLLAATRGMAPVDAYMLV